jgi:ABC-type nitrate/sulfonate/bicarbonate transport system permease component
MNNNKFYLNIGYGFLGLFLLIFFWFYITELKLVSKIFLPLPSDTFNSLISGLIKGDLIMHAQSTLRLMILGWFFSSFIGVLIGSFIGIIKLVRDALNPILEFMRPLPASAIIPVAIAVFGLTPEMMIVVVAFGSLWPTLLATVHGFSSIEKRLVEVAIILQFTRLDFILKIGLPNAIPDILAGMRLSLTVALILSVIVEMLAGQEGLGTSILLAGRSFHSDDMFASLIILSLIGLICNIALKLVERKFVKWNN